MKTLLGIAAALAVVGVSLATIDSAEARGIRGGAGNITRGTIQPGPRVTAPVIRPGRVGTQQFPQRVIRPGRVGTQQFPPRQINGPRESGNGINCRRTPRWVHVPGTSRLVARPGWHPSQRQCPQRY